MHCQSESIKKKYLYRLKEISELEEEERLVKTIQSLRYQRVEEAQDCRIWNTILTRPCQSIWKAIPLPGNKIYEYRSF
jgi:hypothetical protein